MGRVAKAQNTFSTFVENNVDCRWYLQRRKFPLLTFTIVWWMVFDPDSLWHFHLVPRLTCSPPKHMSRTWNSYFLFLSRSRKWGTYFLGKIWGECVMNGTPKRHFQYQRPTATLPPTVNVDSKDFFLKTMKILLPRTYCAQSTWQVGTSTFSEE